MSVLFAHTKEFYELLSKQSNEDGIYLGKIVETFGTLNISMSHYTPILNALKELGCIELLERGARGRPTRIRLYDAPEQGAFDALYKSDLTSDVKPATVLGEELAQRISNIERRLEGLDVKAIVVDHESRIKKLETKPG